VRSLPRRGRIAVPSVAAGVLLALSLPPWGWWPLGLVGAGLLYWRLAGLSWRARIWSGWLAGLGCYAIGLFWARAFNWYGAVVLILIEALFFAAAAVATPPRRGRALAFVGACTLAESVRMTWPFGGLPLGGVFLGQARGPLVQLARLGGPLLITAGVWAGGVVLATAGTAVWRRVDRRRDGLTNGQARAQDGLDRQDGSPRLIGTLVIVAGLIVLAVVGLVAPDGGAPLRTVRVALVQGGGQRGLSKEQISPSAVLAAQLAATFTVASAHPSPALVLWPEDVVALDRLLAGSPQAALLSRLARQLHTTLLVGVTEPASSTSFRNEVVAWGPSGHVVGVFEKVHRVPFGEYVPLRSFFSHFADLSGVPVDAIPGRGTGLMRTHAAPLGLLVSFEIFYAGRSHESVRAGAQLLAVPTNTSSYSTSQVPTQEVAAAIVQSVETGRDLVQAAPTGFSAVVTQRGVVVLRSALGRRQVLFATVALRSGFTPYDHWGDLPVLILALVALLAGWVRQLRLVVRRL
jgi:apolipoprotein N-acyltransferase